MLAQRRKTFSRPGPLRAAFGGAALVAAALAGSPAWADAVGVQYALSLAGLPIGTATLDGTFNRDAYKVDVRAKLTGLAGLLTSGKGAGSATGTTSAGKVIPSTYALISGGSSSTYTVRMALNGGTVGGIEINPPLDPKVDRVPLLEQHKKGVVDPVSALLMPVPDGAPLVDPAACNRTIPVFDGAGRFDVTLSYAETRKVDVKGYSGPVVVCSARYIPIAGHRAGRKATQFMAENRDMEAWLAPVEGAHLLVPIRISVRTMIGTTVIEANRFSVTKTSADANAATPKN